MRLLLLLFSLSGLAAAGEAKGSVDRMAERLKTLSPGTRRLVKFLSGQLVERCGICGDISVDAGGLSCAEQVGRSHGKCGNACREKILLVPAFALEDKGFKPAGGGLAAGGETLSAERVTEALQLAQIRRGYPPRKFRGAAVAVCR